MYMNIHWFYPPEYQHPIHIHPPEKQTELLDEGHPEKCNNIMEIQLQHTICHTKNII